VENFLQVIQPDNGTFTALSSLIEEVSSEESEQTLINHYWLDRYHVLHYTYNFAKHVVMSPTRFDIYVDRYMDTVKVVHFLGVKPWLCSRDHDCMRHVTYYAGPSNMYLYDLWWTMFESMCEEGPIACVS
jgi:lipopolysaccharide biosynthesis glycosyltransferase